MNQIVTQKNFNEMAVWKDTIKHCLPTIVDFGYVVVVYWPNGKMNNFKNLDATKESMGDTFFDAFNVKVISEEDAAKIKEVVQ